MCTPAPIILIVTIISKVRQEAFKGFKKQSNKPRFLNKLLRENQLPQIVPFMNTYFFEVNQTKWKKKTWEFLLIEGWKAKFGHRKHWSEKDFQKTLKKSRIILLLKFIYSEKATKFCEIINLTLIRQLSRQKAFTGARWITLNPAEF